MWRSRNHVDERRAAFDLRVHGLQRRGSQTLRVGIERRDIARRQHDHHRELWVLGEIVGRAGRRQLVEVDALRLALADESFARCPVRRGVREEVFAKVRRWCRRIADRVVHGLHVRGEERVVIDRAGDQRVGVDRESLRGSIDVAIVVETVVARESLRGVGWRNGTADDHVAQQRRERFVQQAVCDRRHGIRRLGEPPVQARSGRRRPRLIEKVTELVRRDGHALLDRLAGDDFDHEVIVAGLRVPRRFGRRDRARDQIERDVRPRRKIGRVEMGRPIQERGHVLVRQHRREARKRLRDDGAPTIGPPGGEPRPEMAERLTQLRAITGQQHDLERSRVVVDRLARERGRAHVAAVVQARIFDQLHRCAVAMANGAPHLECSVVVCSPHRLPQLVVDAARTRDRLGEAVELVREVRHRRGADVEDQRSVRRTRFERSER